MSQVCHMLPIRGHRLTLASCRDLRALLKKLKADQAAADKKQAQLYSRAFQQPLKKLAPASNRQVCLPSCLPLFPIDALSVFDD